MSFFNIGEYILVVKDAFVSSKAQGPAGSLVFDQLGCLLVPRIFVDNAKISKIVNHTINPPIEMINAVSKKEIVDKVVFNFNNEVAKDINPFTIENVCLELLKLINNDLSYAKKYKDELNHIYENENRSTFLAFAFVYVIGNQNVTISKSNSAENIPFLNETNYRCGNCNRSLVLKVRGSDVYSYEITTIYKDSFPETLIQDISVDFKLPTVVDSSENKIALCPNCFLTYENYPDKETFSKLYNKKRSYEQKVIVEEITRDLDIESEIFTVLKGLENLNNDSAGVILSFDPQKLVNKIPDDLILKDDVTQWVLKYYKFIEEQFSNIDSYGSTKFNIIAAQVKLAFEHLDKRGTLSQREIFSILSNWIAGEIGYSTHKIGIVNIVVAFFVQNCEVFYALPE